ncbi:MAG: UDP-3-O-(3-hydroxymyristoyl)glucosamine N-acyltransferase [Phycisphaerales bacterium]
MADGASFEASAGEIAGLLSAGGMDARVIGDASVRVSRVEPIDRAGPEALAFVRSEAYLRAWAPSRAGVTLVSAPLMELDAAAPLHEAADRAVIVVPDADLALVALLAFMQQALPSGDPEPGVHPTAVIDPSATVGQGCRIGPYAVVGAGASIGDNSVLRAHAVIGVGARVGASCVLREHVVLGDRCELGDRAVLHTGVRIGADGFGYRPPNPALGTGPYLVKIPHLGIVRIGSDVEIGANSCVDRATYGVTEIHDGVKIDNIVQIGHNCTIGAGTIICGCCGVGGSTRIGTGVTVGGGTGVADNLVLGDACMIGASSGVTCNVPAGEVWAGTPARALRRHLRKQASLDWLADAIAPLRQLLRERGHDG